MPKEYEYSSELAPYINGLVREKRSMGFKFNEVALSLKGLDDYWKGSVPSGSAVTAETVMPWILSKETGTIDRLGSARQLCKYMCGLGAADYVPEMSISKAKPASHVMSPAELRAFFSELDSYSPEKSNSGYIRMAKGHKVFFRLVLTTGMRNKECCTIRVNDIDWEKRTIHLYGAKGRKDRLVYFSEDVATMLDSHVLFLKESLGFQPEWLFPGKDPCKPVDEHTTEAVFKAAWGRTTFGKGTGRQPTVHSLRHTYVVMRINQWALEGKDTDELMPFLSRQLGHSSVNETFYYYHQVKEAFEVVAEKTAAEANVFPEVKRR